MTIDEEALVRAMFEELRPRAAFASQLLDGLVLAPRIVGSLPPDLLSPRPLWRYGAVAGGFGAATAAGYVLLRRHHRRGVA